jgi:TRAP-type C4-dicarboxylate transport system permease small subunit
VAADPLFDAAQRAARSGALAGGLLMLAAAALVSVDVVVRKLANVTLGGADELSGYALAIGSTWSFAFVLLHRGNVRIDALYHHLSAPLAAACDLLAVLALLVFGGVVAWHGWGVVAQSWASSSRSNSALAVPLVVPQALWWAGYAWFVGCALLLLARAGARFLARDWPAVNRLAGARSVEDDAADELAHARGRQGQGGEGAGR